MVVHFFHASDIFRSDNGNLPRVLIGNDAVQMDDTAAHHDVQAKWTPIVLLQAIDDAAANVVVVSGRIGDVAGEARDRLQQVGARNDADERLASHNRQALDIVLFHRSHDFLERSILGDRDRFPGHNFGYVAAIFVHEIDCFCPGAENEFEPPAALAPSADLAPAKEIALRYDADNLACRINHWESADMLLQHLVRRFEHGRLGCHRKDCPGHDLMGTH
jgi:hypothetical protein